MPEKRILHAENYWHLSCLGYVFSNIESLGYQIYQSRDMEQNPYEP